MITDKVVKCMEKLHIDVGSLKKRQEERKRARIDSKCKELLFNGVLACKGMSVGCTFPGQPFLSDVDLKNMQTASFAQTRTERE